VIKGEWEPYFHDALPKVFCFWPCHKQDLSLYSFGFVINKGRKETSTPGLEEKLEQVVLIEPRRRVPPGRLSLLEDTS
jgi:hypothetical protein